MEIEKSTRHQKIIGDFGEALVCNWLSRSGFEVAMVDHTGIDILARNPQTKERLVISVKSRTRKKGKENESVNIFEENDRQKLSCACEAFAAEPCIAIYVECSDFADLFLLSVEHYDREYRGSPAGVVDVWRMGPKYKQIYEADAQVRHIRTDFRASS